MMREPVIKYRNKKGELIEMVQRLARVKSRYISGIPKDLTLIENNDKKIKLNEGDHFITIWTPKENVVATPIDIKAG